MEFNSLAIYVHWPFCLAKCPYCDFNSHVANSFEHQTWVEAYCKEIEHFRDVIKGKFITSIFFGGGTPSLMSPLAVNTVINKIARIAMVGPGTEITLEANPTSFEVEKFEDFRACGVTRVSIGVQSLRDKDLKNLGRGHSAAEAIKAVKDAKSIFEKLSFDLIYARSGQTLKDWQAELKEALSLGADHISLYQLTIEKGTPFYKLHKDGDLVLPDDSLAADMYEWTKNHMARKGYRRYEISNYAKKNHECRHNLSYWRYNSYLGIGPGAHSRIINIKGVTALMMRHAPQQYLEAVAQNGHAIQSQQFLSRSEITQEFLMMGLRLRDGVTASDFKILTNLNLDNVLQSEIVDSYIEHELLYYNKKKLRLSKKGLLMHSYIVPRLIK